MSSARASSYRPTGKVGLEARQFRLSDPSRPTSLPETPCFTKVVYETPLTEPFRAAVHRDFPSSAYFERST
jgi:hypothetical protein